MDKEVNITLKKGGRDDEVRLVIEDKAGRLLRSPNIVTFDHRGCIRWHSSVNKGAGFQLDGLGRVIETED